MYCLFASKHVREESAWCMIDEDDDEDEIDSSSDGR